jgi:hypothetical protein
MVNAKQLRFSAISLLLITFTMLSFIGSRHAFAGQEQWSPEIRKRITQRAYPFPYEKVFDAVVDSLSDNGYVVLFSDKRSGTIVTDYKAAGGFLSARGEVKLNFRLIRTDARSTKIVLNIQCRVYTLNRTARNGDDLITEDDYNKVFTVIGKQISTQ